MPVTPDATDFEEWARQVHAAIVLMQQDPDLSDMSERVARAGIEELLKRIWNARGAADAEAVENRLATLTGWVTSEPYRQHLREAIETLNRR